MIIEPSDLPGRQAYRLLVDCVVPRPIAWVTTMDEQGRVNLAPFSFFQAVGADPPSIIVSIGRHRDGEFKDTGVNALATGELVVNVVTDELAEAMNTTAGEHAFGVDEMKLAGLTTSPSRVVAPPRVAESPVSLECRVSQRVPIGRDGGENQYLVLVCEVVAFHVRDDIYDDGRIDPRLLHPLGRLGGNAYSHPGEIFEMERPPSSRPH
ncbi:MAG: flavin reductase family protein [Thermoleophilia bacterium]